MSNAGYRLERAYQMLSGDDSDERACEAIPESACTHLPRNYLLNVANGACTKLAEQLAGPNLVLPWLLAAGGTPATFIGFLMPVKQLFSLVPQLLVSGQIRAVARRKWVWTAAGLTQAGMLVSMALVALVLPPVASGVIVLLLLAVFSAASGAGSVAFQDVTGKTVPKGSRGAMLSNRALIGGILTIIAGGLLQSRLGGSQSLAPYLVLLVVAATLWILAAGLFASIREDAGATAGGRSPWGELAVGMSLLRDVPGYRRFLLARALLLSVEIAMPFYALYGQTLFGGETSALGLFMLALGLGNVVSSPIWGRFSDRSSRTVMATGAMLGAVTAVFALLIGQLSSHRLISYLYAIVFVLLGISEQGVRLGRKTYLVDGAPKDNRALYVAFANTSVGLVALLGGLLGLVAEHFGVEVVVVLLAVSALGGLRACQAMPEAQNMLDKPS